MVALLDNQPYAEELPCCLDSAIPSYAFATATSLPLQAAFDGGRLTSDGGLPWLAQADTALGLCALIAAHVPEWRTRASQHPLETLVRQRIFQIACGYADQNDAATLRHDPLLKLVCGRLPETGAPLASQPTLSRLDNAMDSRACYRLAVALVHLYLRERDQQGTPTRILLDLDGTDDPTYGAQEGTAYHAFYRQHMYHPLLIFDGDTNQLITAVLRPGNAHVSRGVVPILKRLVPVLQQRWPGVQVVVRADSGFATPALYELCEQWGVEYSIGLVPNARLKRLAEPVLEAARQQQADAPATRCARSATPSTRRRAGLHARRVVIKAELLEKGPNVRFVVTNRTAEALAQYDDYVDRGAAEGWIKDLKNACCADRLSCHTFWANQFRLLLHAAAYWLLDTLRRWLTHGGSPRMQLDTLRVMLLKIGGRVLQVGHQVRLRLASSSIELVHRHLIARAARRRIAPILPRCAADAYLRAAEKRFKVRSHHVSLGRRTRAIGTADATPNDGWHAEPLFGITTLAIMYRRLIRPTQKLLAHWSKRPLAGFALLIVALMAVGGPAVCLLDCWLQDLRAAQLDPQGLHHHHGVTDDGTAQRLDTSGAEHTQHGSSSDENAPSALTIGFC